MPDSWKTKGSRKPPQRGALDALLKQYPPNSPESEALLKSLSTPPSRPGVVERLDSAAKGTAAAALGSASGVQPLPSVDADTAARYRELTSIKAPPRTRRDQTEAAAAGSDRDLWRSAPTFDLVRRLLNGPPSSGAEPSAAWTGDGISSGAEPSAVWAGDGISSGAEPLPFTDEPWFYISPELAAEAAARRAEPGGVWGGDVISSGAEPNEARSGPPVEPLPPPPVDTGGSSVPAEHQGLPTSGFMPEAWASEERGRTPAFGVDKENIGAGGTPYGVNDAFWAKKEYTPLPVGKNGTAADLGRGLGRDASEGWEKLAIAKNLRNMWKKK